MSTSEWIEFCLRRREGPAPGRWLSRFQNAAQIVALAPRERVIPFWPIANIEELQRRRIRAVVRHAYATVPFYRGVMDERGLRPEDFRTADDLFEVPLIEGTDLTDDPMRFARRARPGTGRCPRRGDRVSLSKWANRQ